MKDKDGFSRCEVCNKALLPYEVVTVTFSHLSVWQDEYNNKKSKKVEDIKEFCPGCKLLVYQCIEKLEEKSRAEKDVRTG